MLDYPSIVLPLKKMHVDVEKDKKDPTYVPKDNVFDKMNADICKSCLRLPHARTWYSSALFNR